MGTMPLRTTAIQAAAARGWSKEELSRRTGLALSTIYNLAKGRHTPRGQTIDAIMAAFPDLPYERLFVPVSADSIKSEHSTKELEPAA